jgi:putative ABC transport system permease protein
MNFFENVRIALRALSANKLRSSLTMLGIIIGVGAVVALMAIGQGATASITSQVQGIGSNLLMVFAGQFRGGGASQPSRPSALYLSDYEALARRLTDVDHVVPTFEGRMTLTQGQNSVDLTLTATTASYAPARAYEIAFGRMLTDADQASGARVAVLGSQTAADLFGTLNPVGRSIKINGISFQVVGVLASKGSSGFTNEDETVLVPLETGYARLFGANATFSGKRRVSNILISVSSAEAVDSVMTQTERILRHERGLRPSEEANFTVMSQSQFLDALNTITTTLTVFLGAIAGISLLVGGIGIMNIMLVSVTERTREIGLRKAVGARQRSIMLQFLVETIVLSLTGGLLGIGLGWAISAGIAAAGLIEAQITADSVALAFFFSAAVGLFFGLYPAYRASRLRPIEALRYE